MILVAALIAALPGRNPAGETGAGNTETGSTGSTGANGATGETDVPPSQRSGAPTMPNRATQPGVKGPDGFTPEEREAMGSDHPPITPPQAEGTETSIQWHGHACFYIHSPGGVTVVTDPFDPAYTGYGGLEVRSHIVTVSNSRPDRSATSHAPAFAGDTQQVVREGQFARGDVKVTAIPTGETPDGGLNQIFLIESGKVRLAHLGGLARALTPAEVRQLGKVDVLMAPAGSDTLQPKDGWSVIQALNPKLVLPMGYRTEDTSPQLAARVRPVEDFVAATTLAVTSKNENIIMVSPHTLPATPEFWLLRYYRSR